MSAYSVYVPYRAWLMRGAKSFVPKAIRTRKTVEDLVAVQMRGAHVSEILLEDLATEKVWLDGGAVTYFVASSQVLKMLWDAKMDVRMEDMGLVSFPRAFAVAWPDCEIDGVKLPGCLVGQGMNKVLLKEMSDFYRERVGRNAFVVGNVPDGFVLSAYYWGEKDSSIQSFTGGRPIVGGSLMEDIWTQALSSDKDFETAFKNRLSGGCEPLTSTEMHQQYVLMKMLVRLMVYIKACPEAVTSGFPEGKDSRDLGYPKWIEMDGSSVGWPGGTHASPTAHWRTWHFRSYPRKMDGTKRDGVVFVSGTVVGLEMDPLKVDVVGKKEV